MVRRLRVAADLALHFSRELEETALEVSSRVSHGPLIIRRCLADGLL
jgi:hypothetical protein